MWNPHCCVPGCTSSKKTNREITFHRFPPINQSKVFNDDADVNTLTDRHELWITKLKISKEVSSCMVVCSLHFKEEDYFEGAAKKCKKVLKPAALPSMNLPTMMTDPIPSRIGIYNSSKNSRFKVQCLNSKCSYEFEWKFQLDHHLQRKHKNVHAAELFHANVEPEQFSCVFCKFTTFFYHDLYEHYKHHHGMIDENNMDEQRLVCDEQDCRYLCNCRYKSNSSLWLVKHRDSCTRAAKPLLDNPSEIKVAGQASDTLALFNAVDCTKKSEQIQCTKCPYKSRSKRILKLHVVRNHTPSEKANKDLIECGKCSYKAKFMSILNFHMLKHSSNEEIDWLQCPKCSYRSIRKGNLNRHIYLQHTPGEEILEEINCFQCPKCSYTAKRKNDLKRHVLLVHNPERKVPEKIQWLQCSKCAYRAKLKRYLKSHVSLEHTPKSKPFQGAECSYRANRKIELKKHVILKHDYVEKIQLLRCTKCIFKTKQKSTLKRHMMKHTFTEEIALFQCSDCTYITKHKSRLKKHIMLQHACSKNVNRFQWLPSVGSITVGSNIVVGSKETVQSLDHTYSLMI